ncbi:hypothetical protein JRQ81_001029 [Phrynocephalus forsythii]|uniref:Uncharacterized protein n=1 Tax=Phrynocephalus forsythii TaxID=171643 RepID=A0A9Q0Y6D3_9SAUR|nr:hypothetical protein JRQ81_001029 [Phrynocephalus forsythii]
MAETGLSYGTAWRNIHEELQMNKVSACWVPHLLTPLQKQTRHDFSQQNLTLLEQNEDNFLLVSSLWTSAGHGAILADYLLKGETLNSDYYCNLLEKLCDALKQKCRGMISKGVSLLANNAPVHPPYSPHLAPSNFFLFPEMKKPLCDQRFDDREDVIFKVEQWFLGKVEDFYKEGLQQVKKH